MTAQVLDSQTTRHISPPPPSLRTAQHLPWIDSAKGIGIAIVVLGHLLDAASPLHRFIYVFHMPLFFFLSGYLHTPEPDHALYLKKKTARLLVPYAAFLLVLFGFECLRLFLRGENAYASQQAALDFLWGGNKLRGDFAVFWFVSCLFLTQQLANALLTILTRTWIVSAALLSLVLSDVNSWLFPEFQLPFSTNVVLAALPFYLVGYFARKSTMESRWLQAFAVSGTALAFFLVWRGVGIDFNMRGGVYGLPILSPLLSLACIYFVLWLSKAAAPLPLVARTFLALGTSSMGIMFLHLPVGLNLHFLRHIGRNAYLLWFITLVLCYLLTRLLARSSWTRRIFLGS